MAMYILSGRIWVDCETSPDLQLVWGWVDNNWITAALKKHINKNVLYIIVWHWAKCQKMTINFLQSLAAVMKK